MNRTSKRRWVVASGALTGLVVVVCIAANWREVEVHYRLWQLERDPELFDASLDAADGSVEAESLRRYVRTDSGRERFVRTYVEILAKGDVFGLWDPGQESLAAMRNTIGVILASLYAETGKVTTDFLFRNGQHVFGGGEPDDPDGARRLSRFFAELVGRDTELSEYRPLVFRFAMGCDAVRYFEDIVEDKRPSPPGDRPVLVILGKPRIELGIAVVYLGSGALRIASVEPGSIAARDGIRVGDRLIEIDGHVVRAEYSIRRAIGDHAPGDRIDLVVERDGTRYRLSILLEAGP